MRARIVRASWGLDRTQRIRYATAKLGPTGLAIAHLPLQVALEKFEAWNAIWGKDPARHTLPNAANALVQAMQTAWRAQHWADHRRGPGARRRVATEATGCMASIESCEVAVRRCCQILNGALASRWTASKLGAPRNRGHACA